jgi:hypothetical protein
MTKDGPGHAGVIVLVVGGRDRVLGHIDGNIRCDLELVDDLLRLHLAARRRGWTIRLVELRPDLRELVELVGVADLLGSWGPAGASCGHADENCGHPGVGWGPAGAGCGHPDEGCGYPGVGWGPAGAGYGHPDEGCGPTDGGRTAPGS